MRRPAGFLIGNVFAVVAAGAWVGCGGSGGGGPGTAGTTGSAGSAGTTGGAGTTGTAGTTGGAGTTGAAGTTGVAGTTGTAGTTGAAGTSGSAGTTGAAGTTGTAGRGGTTGTAGTTGRGGTTGAAGTTGTAGSGGVAACPATPVTFTTRTLSTQQVGEGADVGDINGDGVLDLVAGPTWYAGPNFATGGMVIASLPTLSMDQYSTFFLTFVDDVNGDTRPDIIGIGDAGGGNGSGNPNAFWYANPGSAGLTQPWTKTAIYNGLVSNESPAFVNLVADSKRELVFMTSNQLGYARPGATATSPWTFTAVSGTTSFGTPFVHGLGVGDVDGDGMPDIVERNGWWRQVAGATWERHAFDFWMGSTSGRASNWGGSEMYVYDVDGDGDNDVVTVLAAHQYGLAWFEHQGTGTATTFVAHEILPTAASSSNLSQMHSMVVADVNGDGLMDLVTGKRWYAHPSSNKDPGTDDPALTVWFELRREGGAHYCQHVIHSASGAGCNFVARDVNGDGKVDVFTTNKHGTFLHLQN
ncbi:MAG TPA: VCBS repeat-containing protein [Polyangia bacterium]